MRISDWSSDVCSSDLLEPGAGRGQRGVRLRDRYLRPGGIEGHHGFAAGLIRHGPYSPNAAVIDRNVRIEVRLRQATSGGLKPLPRCGIGSETKRAPATPGLLESLTGCVPFRSEEHTSELQSLLRISYAVFCLKKKKL